MLDKVEDIKDFGLIYQRNFEFNLHVISVTSKAFRILGLKKRFTKEFSNMNSIISLYKTFVRPYLLYGLIKGRC